MEGPITSLVFLQAKTQFQLDGEVIRHARGYFAQFGPFCDQLFFGLIPKRVHLAGRLTRRLPELICSRTNFFFSWARHLSFHS
jgi:hypothetical protein